VTRPVLIQRILDSFDAYAAGAIDEMELARNIEITGQNLEGDVPADVRKLVYETAGDIEIVHFAEDPTLLPDKIKQMRAALEEVITRNYPSP